MGQWNASVPVEHFEMLDIFCERFDCICLSSIPVLSLRIFRFQYANVEKMSLFEHEKIRNKERQRKRFNDPGMVALKKMSMEYLNSVRAKEATTQSSRNSRSSLHSVDQSILDQTVRQSLTSSRLSQGSTNDTTMPRVNQSSIELVDRQSLGPIRRVGLNSTSTATVSDQTGADSSAETISDDEIPRKRLRSVDGE